MYCLIAISLALAYAALKPLGEGLFDTSMWVAKILTAPETEDNETSRQFIKIGQAALMDGWLSNIPFIATILFLSSIVVGFICSWWVGILMYFVSVVLGVLTKLIFMRSVSYYLPLLHHKMVNRELDYKRQGDASRAQAAESYCKDLLQIMHIYQNARLRPPTAKQLTHVPYGDLHYWLEHGATNA
jgi:hypothetical protein